MLRKPGKERTNTAAMRRATADLHRGMKMMADARRTLARVTRPGAPHVVVSSELRWAYRLLEARREMLRAYPGVVGYGLGRVVKDEMATDELCVTVFVRRKLNPAALRRGRRKKLPRSLSAGGRRIRVDVVELGDIERHSFIGESLGPNTPEHLEGTIGAFATDDDGGGVVAITAMHVTGLTDFPNGDNGLEFVVPSLLKHDPNTDRLGVLKLGTMTGVDAAKIALDDASDADSTIRGIGAAQGWRPVAIPGDENLKVTMSGAVSGVKSGRIIHPSVDLPDNDLDGAILVSIDSDHGDSGAPLVDPEKHILGFLVGVSKQNGLEGLRIFTPAASVVNILKCDF